MQTPRWPLAERVMLTGPTRPVVAGTTAAFTLKPTTEECAASSRRFDKAAFDAFAISVTRQATLSSGRCCSPIMLVPSMKDATLIPLACDTAAGRPRGAIQVKLSWRLVKHAGDHIIRICRNGRDVCGSPYFLQVRPGPPVALRLLADPSKAASTRPSPAAFAQHRSPSHGAAPAAAAGKQEEQEFTLVAGVESRLHFQTVDRCGNACALGGADLTVDILRSGSNDAAPTDGRPGAVQRRVIDCDDGVYVVCAQAVSEGQYACKLTLLCPPQRRGAAMMAGGRSVHELQFRLRVAPSVAHAASCRLVGLPDRVRTHEVVCFTLIAHDACGNRVCSGGDQWRMRLVSTKASRAIGHGSAAASEAALPSNIPSWDPFTSDPYARGEADGGSEPQEFVATDGGDGTYACRLLCTQPGTFLATLYLGWQQGTRPPPLAPSVCHVFRMRVVRGPIPGGASAAHSHAEPRSLAALRSSIRQRVPASLTIQTCDGAGIACTYGGAPLHALIVPSGPSFGEVHALRDHGDGTYTVAFVAFLSARYALHVTIDGTPIQKSPLLVDVPIREPATAAVAPPSGDGPLPSVHLVHTGARRQPGSRDAVQFGRRPAAWGWAPASQGGHVKVV